MSSLNFQKTQFKEYSPKSDNHFSQIKRKLLKTMRASLAITENKLISVEQPSNTQATINHHQMVCNGKCTPFNSFIFDRWFVVLMFLCVCVGILSFKSSGKRKICGSQQFIEFKIIVWNSKLQTYKYIYTFLTTSFFVFNVICMLYNT